VTDLFALTERLCAIPSVSGDEAAIAAFVEDWLGTHALGLAVERVANNVVARTQTGASERVVLGGHLDTVPPNGNEQPRRDGDTLHGLGTADMKGGLAVLLDLAASVSRAPGARDTTVIFYEGEEVADEHNGLRHLFDQRPDLVAGDVAVLLEPTGGWIEAGCQGTLHVRATVLGARAHTARPWMGDNAIHRAAPILARCAAFVAEDVDVDGLRYREALQVVQVDGGVANNVVPDRCDIVVNRRIAPSRIVEDEVARVTDLLADADRIDVLNASPPAPPNLTHPLVAQLVAAGPHGVRPKLGWTDVARFAAHGIPACNFGPGDPELAHTAAEAVTRADLEHCVGVLRGFLGVRSRG
jgi:succinyl-diaminopimelate desuccinylase